MKVMRAIRVSSFGGPEVLKLLADVPVPSVSSGQDATDGCGADVIIEMLANVSLTKDLQLVAVKGRIGDEKQEMAAAIAAGMEVGFVNPIVGQEYQLTQASDAHRDIIEGKGAKGKVVLVL